MTISMRKLNHFLNTYIIEPLYRYNDHQRDYFIIELTDILKDTGLGFGNDPVPSESLLEFSDVLQSNGLMPDTYDIESPSATATYFREALTVPVEDYDAFMCFVTYIAQDVYRGMAADFLDSYLGSFYSHRELASQLKYLLPKEYDDVEEWVEDGIMDGSLILECGGLYDGGYLFLNKTF